MRYNAVIFATSRVQCQVVASHEPARDTAVDKLCTYACHCSKDVRAAVRIVREQRAQDMFPRDHTPRGSSLTFLHSIPPMCADGRRCTGDRPLYQIKTRVPSRHTATNPVTFLIGRRCRDVRRNSCRVPPIACTRYATYHR